MPPRLLIFAGVVLAIPVLWLIIGQLPGGYATDLDQVGDGRPAVVLIHDDNLVASGQLMHAVDRLRRDFEPDVIFLVADQVRPDGIDFAERHGLPVTTLALFDGRGELLGVYRGGTVVDADHLRRWLLERLSTAPPAAVRAHSRRQASA